MPFDSEITTKSRDLIVLEKARERVAQGWVSGQALDAENSVCLVGALWLAIGGDAESIFQNSDEDDGPLENSPAVLRLVKSMGFRSVHRAIVWNDESSWPEVLARFDAAIAKLSAAQ